MSSSEPSQDRRQWTLSKVQIAGLPKARIGPFKKRYCYFKVAIDELPRVTSGNVAVKDSKVTWNERLKFATDRSSTIAIEIYFAHPTKADELAIRLELTTSSLPDGTDNLEFDIGSSQSRGGPRYHITLTIEPVNMSTLGNNIKAATDKLSGLRDHKALDEVNSGSMRGTAIADEIDSHEDPWESLLDKVQTFSSIMQDISEIHPYVQAACQVLLLLTKPITEQLKRDHKISALLDTITDMYARLNAAQPLEKIETHKVILTQIAQQTNDCAQFISDYALTPNFWERAMKNLFSSADSAIDRYTKNFSTLWDAFHAQSAIHIEVAVLQVAADIQGLALEMALKDICAPKARYIEKQCLSGTRTQLLAEISSWIDSSDPAVPRVMLLSGPAGTGKSTIACTIAAKFAKLNRLGSFFCFSTSNVTHVTPESVLATLARDIGSCHPLVRSALWNEIQQQSPNQQNTVDEDFDKYLLRPATALITSKLPLVMVIDALDEMPYSVRSKLLSLFANRLAELPPTFRILLTARGEEYVNKPFRQSQRAVHIRQMPTIKSDRTLEGDVLRYIRYELVDRQDRQLPGLAETNCHTLGAMAEGLFQWAFIACDYIASDNDRGGTNPRRRYEKIVQSAGLPASKGIDSLSGLYNLVLSQRFDTADAEAMKNFRYVMGTVMAVFDPLSQADLQNLLNYDGSKDTSVFGDVLPFLGSLLSGAGSPSDPVWPAHSSFRDFILNPYRAGPFYIDCSLHQQSLAKACLRDLNSNLCFNICRLETSYVRNRDVFSPDMMTRVTKYIPTHLSYACMHWAQHLSATYSKHLLGEVQTFLEVNLLFWLEALSVIGALNMSFASLSLVITWLGDYTSDLARFARDGQRFVRAFASMMSNSAPHVYISALTCAPAKSLIKQHYSPRCPFMAHIATGLNNNWTPLLAILRGQYGPVESVSFSPDGTRIISGSDDQTIRIWDAETGEAVLEPLKGHNRGVNSVAFSPDGTRIISGSDDGTIRIWDAETGEAVLEPLMGHRDGISSVAFSPDGTRIISGSDDQTIRIWDAETGEAVLEPLKGHNRGVSSIAFSPDGTRIISGSDDGTIRIWDAETGEAVLEPLKGHNRGVSSIAFSPDGTRIISGSDDGTIRIWDAETGEAVLEPLKGHSDGIKSVAFSPDGTRIVSGSLDRTIRIWDAETGEAVLEPLKGHNRGVKSVAFSPDGTRIISGSYDRTIRIWDAETGEAVLEPLKGHSDGIESVAFSPDGTRIVSGSYDRTIRIWDAETGEAVLEPLKGHNRGVNSVAFSPDGTRIISGSWDQTIRIWDAETGEAVLEPLKGHNRGVNSVAFSPDGTRIVSGSLDRTIRIWDAETGEAVLEPLKGHSDGINSVAFSPDGTRIISGSDDGTIRIWDAETGEAVLEPLKGHNRGVSSIAFSPDGTRIISGSDDGTIRIWDAETGEAVLEPLKGHSDWIKSVAFSPDGTHIISGSYDGTIRIWDAETGEAVLEPLKGHNRGVNSVAFSPDGTRIISGSLDRTIRIWDAETGEAVLEPLKGHNRGVKSVAFSPDGTRIISGSGDRAIQILDDMASNMPARFSALDRPMARAQALSIEPYEVHPARFGSNKMDSVWTEVAHLGSELFSRNPLHAASQPFPLSQSPLQANTYSVTIEDEWILGANGELLLCLPPDYMPRLCRHGRTILTIPGPMVQLDLSRFRHGPSWQEVIRGDLRPKD